MMDSGRLIFDSTSSSNPGYTLFFQGERSLFGMEQRTNKRLPFFTSSEELEEEYYDEQLPEKKRRLTAEQVHMLEKSFESENKLEPERKGELAKKLGLQPRQVAVWFQNRRARWKNKQLEHDYDRLKAAYDALLADHDSLLKDNNGLRSQMASLNEKLQNKQIAAGPASESSTDTDNKVHSIHEMNFNAKAEDYQSTGSRGSSGVLDKESYFHENFDDCIVGAAAIDGGGGVHSEEDDGSDDGCNYMPSGIFGENTNTTENWWGVWN